MVLAEPPARGSAPGHGASDDPSAAIHAEWQAANPQTPEEIAAFYRDAQHYPEDLDAWHETEARRSWTEALVHVATSQQAERIVDIGCGVGHDLAALREALPSAMLFGVEPNRANRERATMHADRVVEDVAQAPIEAADILCSFDVLEHVADPETFLAGIATRARLGCLLVETTATHDLATPLHLNPGWHPGHALEAAGWVLVDRRSRLRVWQRVALEAPPIATVAVCSWRAVSIATTVSILNLAGIQGALIDEHNDVKVSRMAESPWRVTIKSGDGLISRSRSIVASQWYRESASDVLLMVDDDIGCSVQDAERIVALCREKRAIVCGAYPVGDCSHLAIRAFGGRHIDLGPGLEPVEIEYGSTGFFAIHRDVLDAMVPTLPLCHADTENPFWPMFAPCVSPMGKTNAYLSEDWSFCLRARHLGFPTWLDREATLTHVKEVGLTVHTMGLVAQAIQKARA